MIVFAAPLQSEYSHFSIAGKPNYARRSGVITSIEDVVVLHGGDNGATMMPASPAMLQLRALLHPTYSFPWNAWPRSSVFAGSYDDIVGDDNPPKPQLFSVLQLLTTSPVIFGSTTRTFEYTEGSDISQFFLPNTTTVSAPSTSAWSTYV